MKLDYCSPSEVQKNKKQLGDCSEEPASSAAGWEDRMNSRWRWADDCTDASPEIPTAPSQGCALTLSVLDPTQFTSSEKKELGGSGSKGDLSFWRSGGSSLDRASHWVFWRTVASSLTQIGATHFRLHELPGHGSEQMFGKWLLYKYIWRNMYSY